MNLHTLRAQQHIPLPLDRVFEFFQHPENLQHITPPELGFFILTPSPIEMKEGALIDYTIRIGGIPIRWTTLITAYRPPYLFVDQQLRGPYSFWHHTHRFSEKDGGTLMEDEVRYALPFGFLGTIVNRIIVRKQVEQIFSYRSQVIEKLLMNLPPPAGDTKVLAGNGESRR